LQDIQNARVMVSLEPVSVLGRHKPEAGGFCLDLGLIIRGVSRGCSGKIRQGTGNRVAPGFGGGREDGDSVVPRFALHSGPSTTLRQSGSAPRAGLFPRLYRHIG
jgi:hypothetical protein